jgi:hypothetical protein
MFILVDSHFVDEEIKEGSWGLNFDGAHSSTGSGAGIVLRSSDNETNLFSYKLEFDCTNNIVEYEALILGINPGHRHEHQEPACERGFQPNCFTSQ